MAFVYRPGVMGRQWIKIEKNGKHNESCHDFGDSRCAGDKKIDNVVGITLGKVKCSCIIYLLKRLAEICTHLQVGPESRRGFHWNNHTTPLQRCGVSIPIVAIEHLTASMAPEGSNVRGLIKSICPWPFVRLYYPLTDHTSTSIPLWCRPWRGLWEPYRRLQALVIKVQTCPSSETKRQWPTGYKWGSQGGCALALFGRTVNVMNARAQRH